MIPEPQPYIAAYKVGTLRYSVVDTPGGKKVVPEWTTAKPAIVNTNEIAAELRKPDTFLLGWQEVHHFQRQEMVGGSLALVWREEFVSKEHLVNIKLIQTLSQMAQQTLNSPDNTTLPRIRSFERFLFDHGWEFKWTPRGKDDPRLGAVFSDALRDKWTQQPEHRIFTTALMPEAGYTEPIPEYKTDPEEVFGPRNEEDKHASAAPPPDRLELKMDQMLDVLGKLVTIMTEQRNGAASHSPPSDQLGAGNGLEQQAVVGAFDDADAGYPAIGVSEPSAREDGGTGLF